jgi:hypothetical protein
MSALTDAAARCAVLKTLTDTVKAAYEDSRKVVHELMVEQGAERVSAAIGEQKIAQIVLTEPKPSISLIEDDFLDWVTLSYDHELVHTVRSSFKAAILARLVAVDGQVVDTKTGAVVEWARVNPASERYTTTKLNPGGREAILAAWHAGDISLDALSQPEIEAS